MDNSQFEKLKKQESNVIRSLLKKQNGMLGQSLLHTDHLIYLQKSISLMSLEAINKVLADKLPFILFIRYFSLFLFDKNKRILTLACHNHPDLKEILNLRQKDSEIMSEAINSGTYVLEQNYDKSRFFKGVRNPLFQYNFFITIPLMIENEIIGVLNLNDNEKGNLNVTDLDYFLNVSEVVSVSISNAQSYEKAERLSVTDGLTGLTNRQQFQTLLQNEILRCRRYDSPLSLVMMDVDYFKGVNDTFGHQEGDDVLMGIAGIIKSLCRAHDVAGRYGGEEFVLILPETNGEGARMIAERIREEVEKCRFKHEESVHSVTISCGIAEFQKEKIRDLAHLIGVADDALYQAKESGRNRTVMGTADDIFKDR
ncbi:MAG: GGDEF domain-containing protein [Nitrospinaceae bacterium]|nr:MAG: GGDEF domain-containing protein [Nitrospinaceae bacterium]